MHRLPLMGVLLALSAPAATQAAAQTIAGCGATAIAKADAGSIPKLTKGADCFGKARTIAASAEQTRRDRIATIMSTPPKPVPGPPTAMPAFAPTAKVAPTIAGIDGIASGLDVAGLLQKSWGTGDIPGSGGGEGAFRFNCYASHNAYDDPIVYPGQPGKSHLHTFFGNTRADSNSTYASLRTSGDSTCVNPLNRSAYWIAAMIDGDKVVMPDYLTVYYKRSPAGAPDCQRVATKGCIALPRGLRYVFGYKMGDPANSDPAGARWWNCDGPGAVSGHFATIAEALKGCPVGARLGAIVVAPPCWNGKDLDSPDHRRHMAWPSYGDWGYPKCPAGYPYLIPQFQLQAWFVTTATTPRWHLSSDNMPGMPVQPPGTTLHADWFGAWEESILERWTAHCIDKDLSCSGGDLGDGTQLKIARRNDFPAGHQLVDLPPPPMSH